MQSEGQHTSHHNSQQVVSQFLQGIEYRSKPALTVDDCKNAKSFSKVSDELLSKSGKQLKKEALSQVVYYKHMAHLPAEIKSKLTYYVEAPCSVPSNILFLKDAANMYDTNPKFRWSLVVGLLNADANRADGTRNA